MCTLTRTATARYFVSRSKAWLKCFCFLHSRLQRSVQWHQPHRGGGLQRSFIRLEPHRGGQGKRLITNQEQIDIFRVTVSRHLPPEGRDRAGGRFRRKGRKGSEERRSGWGGRGGIPEMCLAPRRLSPKQERATTAYACGAEAPRWGRQTGCRCWSMRTGSYQQEIRG